MKFWNVEKGIEIFKELIQILSKVPWEIWVGMFVFFVLMFGIGALYTFSFGGKNNG